LFTVLTEKLRYRVLVNARLLNGMKVVVPWNDHVGGSIYSQGYYEKSTLTLIEKLLEPNMVFIDVGGHIGQYTLVASAIVGDGGQVHSFEPDPDTFRLLSLNVKSNHCGNVHINPVGLFSEEGTKRFYLATTRDIGSNSLAEPSNYAGDFLDITCTTLDKYVEKNKVSKIDLIKIDVEGAEHHMLRGASNLLQQRKPVMIIEFEEARQKSFGFSCAKLGELIAGFGYILYYVSDETVLEEYSPEKHGHFRSLNILAVHRSKRDSVLASLSR
jgi:FkbM family methyltransferase